MVSQNTALDAEVSTDEFVFGANLVRDTEHSDFDRKCRCPMSTFRKMTYDAHRVAGGVMMKYDEILNWDLREARGIVDEDTAREAWLQAIEATRDDPEVEDHEVEKAEEVAEFFGWT